MKLEKYKSWNTVRYTVDMVVWMLIKCNMLGIFFFPGRKCLGFPKYEYWEFLQLFILPSLSPAVQ